MHRITVDGKYLLTTPIQSLVIEGESLADTVTISIPLDARDVDLAAAGFTIKAYWPMDGTEARYVLYKDVGGCFVGISVGFFFFKQKTAYEIGQ